MDPNAGAKAKVSLLEGAVVNSVSVAKSSVSGVEVYPAGTSDGRYILWADNPHNFKHKDIVNLTGFSTTSSLIFIYLFPVIYTPAVVNKIGLDAVGSEPLTYFIVMLSEFILISLYNIQDQMEYPFDKDGLDDIKLDDFKIKRGN